MRGRENFPELGIMLLMANFRRFGPYFPGLSAGIVSDIAPHASAGSVGQQL